MPTKRRPPTRKELGLESRYTAKKFRPYALAIGEATLSWNDLHVELGMLYATVSGGGWIDQYFIVWNTLRNDGAKRDILMAAAKTKLNPEIKREKKALSEVNWILKEIKKINDDRNTVAHAALTSTRTTNHVFPMGWTGDRFARRLEGYDVLSEYRRLRDTAIQLRDYTGRLAQAISRPRPVWPLRPNLPTRPKAAIAALENFP